MAAQRTVDPSSFWDAIQEFLVRIHGKTYEEAFNIVVDHKRKLGEAGRDVLAIAYHENPFHLACDLAGNEMDAQAYIDVYREILVRHGCFPFARINP